MHGHAGLASLRRRYAVTAPDPADFRATLRHARLHELQLTELVATAHAAERTRERIHATPSDAVAVFVVRAGEVRLGPAAEAVASAGYLIPVLESRPFRYTSDDEVHLVVVQLPRAVLDADPVLLARLNGRPAPASAATRALGAALSSLLAEPSPFGDAEAAGLSRALVELVRTALVAHADDGTVWRGPGRVDAVTARAMLERSYTDVGLSAARIAGELGVSVRQLHRLFAGESTSFGRQLRRLRAMHLAADLAATGRPLHELAPLAGFGSLDAAQRAFRLEFGTSPAEYRRSARARGPQRAE